MSAAPVKDRLATRFAQCKNEGRAALITFVTGGDPTAADTPAILDALVAGGADIVELGMPFTDPMADGPAIELANLRSLDSGTKTAHLLSIAKEFRERHPETPLILMGYANPMVRRGPQWFADQAKAAGVDGVICVDLPPEEDADLGPALREAGLHLIRLATPTTDAERLSTVLSGASGFLYYVSVAGITGMQQAATASVKEAVTRFKQSTDLPVAVGFGVRTPEQTDAIGRLADAVVVGSAIVDIIGTHGSHAAPLVQDFVATLRAALNVQENVK